MGPRPNEDRAPIILRAGAERRNVSSVHGLSIPRDGRNNRGRWTSANSEQRGRAEIADRGATRRNSARDEKCAPEQTNKEFSMTRGKEGWNALPPKRNRSPRNLKKKKQKRITSILRKQLKKAKQTQNLDAATPLLDRNDDLDGPHCGLPRHRAAKRAPRARGVSGRNVKARGSRRWRGNPRHPCALKHRYVHTSPEGTEERQSRKGGEEVRRRRAPERRC
jgi:hypothetical protein